MFNIIEEVSEIIYKEPYTFCIMGVHKTPDNNDIYTIFVRDDIIIKDGYIKDQKEYDACRISLLYPRYVDLGYNIILTSNELELFIQHINKNWEYIKSLANIESDCPDYRQLKTI